MANTGSVKVRARGTAAHRFRNHLTLFCIRWAVGIPLVASGTGHLLGMYRFLESVYRYDLLAFWLVPLFAAILPPLITVTGLALIAGLLMRAAFLNSALLYMCFSVAQGSALIRNDKIECGCFVWFGHDVSWLSFGLVAAATMLSGIGFVLTLRQRPMAVK